MTTRLQTVMAKLDVALTGKDSAVRNGFATVEQWFNSSEGAWYLSDGGYSRVLCSFEDGCHLFLANVSRKEVIDRWHSAETERTAAESFIRDEWRKLIQTETAQEG